MIHDTDFYEISFISQLKVSLTFVTNGLISHHDDVAHGIPYGNKMLQL
jgi:hypothetical protein